MAAPASRAAAAESVDLMARSIACRASGCGGGRIICAEAPQQLVERRDALVWIVERPRELELVRPIEAVAFGVAFDELQQARRIDARPLGERHAAAFGAGLDLRKPELLGE